MSLLIRNVSVLGSTQDLPERADVFVNGDTISAIGNFPQKSADEVIDGQGAYLSPGFIDVDTTSDHYLTLFSGPGQEDFLRQGVTTIVGGHCGASLAPLLYGSLESIRKWGDPEKVNVDWHTVAELFEALKRRPLGVNFATFAGHSTIRRAMLGEDIRDLAKNEIAVFKGVIEKAMTDGAMGLSSGLEYVHSRGASYAELKALLAAVGPNGIYATHLRHAAGAVDGGMEEAVRLHQETGVPALVSHFVPVHRFRKEYLRALELMDALPAEADFHFDVYPFGGTVFALYRLMPEWAQNGNLELMVRNVADEWLGKRITASLPEIDPLQITIEAARNPDLAGRTLAEFMEFAGVEGARAGLLELMRATRLQAVVSWQNVDEGLLEEALLHPRALIGSHAAAGIEVYERETFLQERARRAFTAFLGRMEEKKMLEEGVRRVTAMPAKKFGFKRRGAVAQGYAADLVIFKSGAVRTVVVNGKVALHEGNPTGALAGRPLRREP